MSKHILDWNNTFQHEAKLSLVTIQQQRMLTLLSVSWSSVIVLDFSIRVEIPSAVEKNESKGSPMYFRSIDQDL